MKIVKFDTTIKNKLPNVLMSKKKKTKCFECNLKKVVNYSSITSIYFPIKKLLRSISSNTINYQHNFIIICLIIK